MDARARAYRAIGDYALIGDARTAALVARDGSVDWCCWPRFDSPAVFCRLLDAEKGGWFRIGPAGESSASRSYLGPTNVLATTFTTGGGRLRVTDFMPVGRRVEAREGARTDTPHRLFRLVEGLAGSVECEVEFRPTFDFARAPTVVTPCPDGAVAHAGDESLALGCPVPLRRHALGGLSGCRTVAAGDRFWVALTYRQSGAPSSMPLDPDDADAELGRTLGYWREWSDACTYVGPYHDLVRRSALVLKLLTFEPTGALVAAPTTSLPEEVGGVRNWDYRYTWLRDASLTLYALQTIGYHGEAARFFEWLEAVCVRCHGELQIVYTIDGGAHLPERTLDHFDGYRRSRPVRVGNAAAGQLQLDVYGEVLEAAHLHLEREHDPPRPEVWATLRGLADRAMARWREPDQGIWEVRGGPRHFLHSKLLCWVALDRVLRLAGRAGPAGTPPADTGRWQRTRDEIRRTILTDGYDAELGAFTQALGEPVLDAAALVIPLVGFLPPTDPRVRSTVARIQERLTSHGLIYRYRTGDTRDGLPGGEATFAPCSFWMVDNLALAGRVGEARAQFERVIGHANDLGLLAEEIEPASGELLGNYPQGFTHLALIRAALSIAKAESSGPERHAQTPAERAEVAERAGRLPDAPARR